MNDYTLEILEAVYRQPWLKTERVIDTVLLASFGDINHKRGDVRATMHALVEAGVIARTRSGCAFLWSLES